jgi:hypothetical protein
MKPVKKNWRGGLFTLLMVLVVDGCVGAPHAEAPAKGSIPTVYAAGSYDDGQKKIPCFWVETSRTDLPGDGFHNAQANCLYVTPWGTINTAGYYSDGNKNVPCRWIGTVRTDLPCSSGGEAISIFVSATGWPYTAGYNLGNGGTDHIPCYWAGNTRIDLPYAGAGVAQAILVVGRTVYSAGYYQDHGKPVPCYWVGSQRKDLPCSPKGAQATSVFVSGGVVYTAGVDGEAPCYWEGTKQTVLRGRGWATSISIAGRTVYVTGQSPSGVACYWVDSEEKDLPFDSSSNSIVYSAIVSEETVYIAGVHYDVSTGIPFIWDGSNRKDFPDQTDQTGVKVRSVVLK